MSIYETELPGVGKKFELDLPDGGRLVVVIHHSGRREVFHKEDPDADGAKLFELPNQLARKLGAILEGSYFQPVASPTIDTLLSEGTVLDWATIDEGSPVAGRTISDCELRRRTGVSVLAIRRGDETFANPDPETQLEVGDTLISLGSSEQIEALESLLEGSSPEDRG